MFYLNTTVHVTNTLLTTHSPHGYFHALASYIYDGNLTLCVFYLYVQVQRTLWI